MSEKDNSYVFYLEEYPGQYGFSFFMDATPVTVDIFSGISAEHSAEVVFKSSLSGTSWEQNL